MLTLSMWLYNPRTVSCSSLGMAPLGIRAWWIWSLSSSVCFVLLFIHSYAKISQAIGIFNPADVRPILQAYAGKDIPIEYAKKEAEAKAKAIEEWERAHPTAITGAGSGFLSSIFGSVAAVGSPFIPYLVYDAKALILYIARIISAESAYDISRAETCPGAEDLSRGAKILGWTCWRVQEVSFPYAICGAC